MLNHKGYIGSFYLDEEKEVFIGKVINSNDDIFFQSDNAKELKKEFFNSVERHIKASDKIPLKSNNNFISNIDLCLPSKVVKKAQLIAEKKGMSLNSWINKTIESELML